MRYFCICLICVFSALADAALPMPDQFMVDGVAHDMVQSPLDKLYSADGIRQKLQAQQCGLEPQSYQGVWELKNQQLFLTALRQSNCNKTAAAIDPQLLFSQQQYPVKASWFSGSIKVPLTDKDYKHCLTDAGSEATIGYAYLAIVYEFIAGDLVRQSEQIVTENWQRPRNHCAKVPTARV